jgi:SAM-dependent methyltransferase
MTKTSENHHGNSALRMGLDICSEVAKNAAMGFSLFREWRLNRPRTINIYLEKDEQAERLERYSFFALRILQGVVGSVSNLRIVELGPGDFMTSGLALLAAGAASYTVIDRFVGDYSKAEAKEYYKEVEKEWSSFFPQLPWPSYLKADDFPEAYPDRVKVLAVPIEEAHPNEKFDIVCSFQVGEHVHSIKAFAEMNARLLAPNGVGVHRVDFGPHGCWSNYHDPLTFLRFPEWLWKLMGSNRGTPNRRRYDEFCAEFENAGLTTDVIVRDLFPKEKINFRRLDGRFRGMSEDSIATGTAGFVCRLPVVSEGENTSHRSSELLATK